MSTTTPLDWDDLPDVYFRIAADGHWAVLSESFESLTGYRRTARLGVPCLHDVIATDREDARQLLLGAWDGAQGTASPGGDLSHGSNSRDMRGEFRLLTSRQSIVAVEVHARQRWSSEGTFIGASGILRDVSTVRALREAVREHEATQSLSAALVGRDTGNAIASLEYLLSLCAWCKKVRSRDGGWQPIEDYFQDRLETQLSHGMCPDCAERLTGQR